MAQYDVLAVAVDPDGTPLNDPRVERVDTDENPLFEGCKGPWDVEDVYHAFWNRLNSSWEGMIRNEKVLVINVRAVED